eukprot:UN09397
MNNFSNITPSLPGNIPASLPASLQHTTTKNMYNQAQPASGAILGDSASDNNNNGTSNNIFKVPHGNSSSAFGTILGGGTSHSSGGNVQDGNVQQNGTVQDGTV